MKTITQIEANNFIRNVMTKEGHLRLATQNWGDKREEASGVN